MNRGLYGQPLGRGSDWPAPYSGASVTVAAAQSMANGTDTINWTVVEWDTDGYSRGSSNQWLVVPAAGYYRLSLWMPWAVTTSASRRFATIYAANGALGTQRTCVRSEMKDTTTSGELNHFCSVTERCNPGDLFFASTFQNTGGAQNTNFEAGGLGVRPRFQIERLG